MGSLHHNKHLNQPQNNRLTLHCNIEKTRLMTAHQYTRSQDSLAHRAPSTALMLHAIYRAATACPFALTPCQACGCRYTTRLPFATEVCIQHTFWHSPPAPTLCKHNAHPILVAGLCFQGNRRSIKPVAGLFHVVCCPRTCSMMSQLLGTLSSCHTLAHVIDSL